MLIHSEHYLLLEQTVIMLWNHIHVSVAENVQLGKFLYSIERRW